MRHFRLILFILGLFSEAVAQNADSVVVSGWLKSLQPHRQKPFSELLIEAGNLQLGTPYKAGLLDQSDSETLTVTTTGADCVLFVENAAAAALCTAKGDATYSCFTSTLTALRYRDATIDGYTSRKHYFTEWMLDLVNEGKIRWVQPSGAIALQKVNFISANRTKYPKIRSEADLDKIRFSEQKINAAGLTYVPKSSIKSVESVFQDGDIVGFVTTVAGLDVSHTGILVRNSGILTFLHASTKGSVRLESQSLEAYLKGRSSVAGIIVGRFNPPKP